MMMNVYKDFLAIYVEVAYEALCSNGLLVAVSLAG
jgi:hypothetical protein